MAVYVSNIVIEQGFTFETTFQLEDTRTNSFLNLSGYGIESKIRKSHDSRNYVSFASSIIQPKFGRISIGLQAGETLLLKPGRYVYDVKIISGGNQYKAVEGSALVRAGVTK